MTEFIAGFKLAWHSFINCFGLGQQTLHFYGFFAGVICIMAVLVITIEIVRRMP